MNMGLGSIPSVGAKQTYLSRFQIYVLKILILRVPYSFVSSVHGRFTSFSDSTLENNTVFVEISSLDNMLPNNHSLSLLFAQDPQLVKDLLALHDKYLELVNDYFGGNALFQKALKV